MAAALDGTSDEPLKDVEKTLQPYPWVGWTANQGSGPLLLGMSRQLLCDLASLTVLLGSPNGIGIGYFLVQHKSELGNRRVRKIEAFLADTAASNLREPSIAWELEDAPVW